MENRSRNSHLTQKKQTNSENTQTRNGHEGNATVRQNVNSNQNTFSDEEQYAEEKSEALDGSTRHTDTDPSDLRFSTPLSGFEGDWDDHNLNEDSSSARPNRDRVLARTAQRRIRDGYGDDIEQIYGLISEDEEPYFDRELYSPSRRTGMYSGFPSQARIMMSPEPGQALKSYDSTDLRIRKEANDRLQQSGIIDASEITVSCKNGILVLSGAVNNREMKRCAENCVEDVSGVDDVLNMLSLKKGMLSQASRNNTNSHSSVAKGH